MPEQNIPPRLKKVMEQAAPPAAPKRTADKRQLLSDVDRLLESVQGTFFDVYAAPPEEEADVGVAESGTAAEPTAGAAESGTAAEPAAGEIAATEITEPVPVLEGLRLDLFGETVEPQPFTTEQSGSIVLTREPIAQEAPEAPQVDEQTKKLAETYEKTVERPGVVLRRVDMQMTTDLSPVPKVVPAAELLQQQKSAPPAGEDVPEGQQRFQGFESDAPDARSEEELLRELQRSRVEHTNQFEALRHLTEKLEQTGETGTAPQPPPPQPLADGETPPFEYTEPGEREGVLRALLQVQKRLGSNMLLQALLCAVACVLLAVSLAAHSQGAMVAAPDGEIARVELPVSQSLPQLLLLLGGLALSGGALLRGAKGLLRGRPNADTLLLAAAVCTLVQTLLACIPAFGGYSYAALLLFLTAMQTAARWLRTRQDAINFRFCAYRPQALYALRTGEEVTQGNGAGALRRQKTVLYPAPARFPTGFVAQTVRDDAMDQISRWLLPLAGGMAAIAGLCGGLIAMDVGAGVSAAAAALCLAVPAAGLLALHSILRGLNRREKESGVAILGSGAAEEISAAESLVVDSGDLFRRSKGRMHGWREYWQVRTDEVLLYAAAIAIASGGPLQAVFEGVVEGDHSVLPKLHQLTFEDKMGLSCWIHNQKVLFGNRKLLENHGISVSLSEREELKYEHGGRKILYLAVEKRLTAFFVVSYQPEEILTPYFQRLQQEDLGVLVCNGDPSITLELLSEGFRLPGGRIEMLRASQSEANRRRMRTPQEDAGASVYHADNIRSYLRAVTACLSLKGSIKRLRIFQVVGSLTAFLLLLLAALTRQLDYANSLVFIAFEAIWAGICYAGARN
ncbi:MAG: hypothetical protein LBS96_05245 [Oscillospiraceae bacterium]|jgi:hypothetical protein|nr:hypothetical protein [Oscillospiraceae bacterium]